MTSVHPLLRRAAFAAMCRAGSAFALLLLIVGLMMSACSSGPKLSHTQPLVSPYATSRPIIWAIAPLRNESGVSFVNELAVSDVLRNEIEQIDGIQTLSINATLEGMRAIGVGEIRSEAQAIELARTLDVDGVIIGTITAWAPYEPKQIGLAIGLFGQEPSMGVLNPTVDPRALQAASTDYTLNDIEQSEPGGPLSVVSTLLDTSNHDVLLDIREYAAARHDPTSALGPDLYIKSMGAYQKFCCFHVVRKLLNAERRRLGTLEQDTQVSSR